MEKVFERVGKRGKNAGGWIWQVMRVLVMGLFRVGVRGSRWW